MTGARTRRRARSRWPVSVVVVVLNAAVQAGLVARDPVPAPAWTFALRVLASLAAMVLSTWVLIAAAVNGTAGDQARSFGTRLRPAGLAWTAGWALVALAVAVIYPLAVPLLLLLAALILPAAVGGARHPIRAVVSGIRRAPLRALVATAVFLACCALSVAVALALGFFITGMVAAAATWLWFGLIAALLLALFARLVHLPAPTGPGPVPIDEEASSHV